MQTVVPDEVLNPRNIKGWAIRPRCQTEDWSLHLLQNTELNLVELISYRPPMQVLRKQGGFI